MKLSQRTAWPSQPNAWTRACARPAVGEPRLDLTCSNPTAVGLHPPPDVLAALGTPNAAHYDPQPLGLPCAREAVARYHRERGRAVSPEQVWICASTSEAYAQLLTILGDPGDAVLVAQPGYPLLDMLGDVAGIRRVPYPLGFDGQWHLDLAGLDAALDAEPRACAIAVVAPHNPTGHVPEAGVWSALCQRAQRRGLAVILDEVFADYTLHGRAHPLHVDDHGTPIVVLSGLSKVAALPQLKLSWAVFHGPPGPCAELRRRAELLADAFLSVATPVQLALPTLLRAAEQLRPRILTRLRTNLAHLRAAAHDRPFEPLPVEAGWTALLRLPAVDDLDDLGWACRLLDAGVRVQPGFLFDLPAPPRIAVSLLTPPDVFAQGIARIRAEVDAVLHPKQPGAR